MRTAPSRHRLRPGRGLPHGRVLRRDGGLPHSRRPPHRRGPRSDSGRPHRRGLRCDDGQVAVEFLGMAPTILVTLVLLWQCVLLGYTYTLAGNAADEAVRAGAPVEGGQGACVQAGLEDLPGAWRDGAGISCEGWGSGYVTARVKLKVPVLLPGLIGFPIPVRAHAGAVQEGRAN